MRRAGSGSAAAERHRMIASSLRAKLILIFAVLTTIPLAVVGYVSYSRAFSTIKENTTDAATQIAEQLNTNIELVFKDSEKFLKIGNNETAMRFLDPDNRSEEATAAATRELVGLFKLFREIYEFDTWIKGIYILGFNGNNLSERDGRFSLGRSILYVETVQRILTRPRETSFVSNWSIDYAPDPGYSNVLSVGKVIARPSDGKALGVIIVDVDGEAIADFCRGVRMGETGCFSVFAKDGTAIFPMGGEKEIGDVSPENMSLIGREDSGHFFQTVRGEREFLAFNTLAGAGWKIIGRVKLKELMRGAYNIRSITITVIVACVFAAIILYFFISSAITHPLRELKRLMGLAESGNLEVRAECGNRDEVADLCRSFNVMIEKIDDLLRRNAAEQENLKKAELRALQAQINPHFLYNTLDAIVWMTEAGRSEDVVSMTKTLSSFFRIVLSKGEEWIPAADEVEHVRCYLAIQRMRYRDILDYSVDFEEGILGCRILKLVLQPIVENAIYHGIKGKRSGGLVSVRAAMLDRDRLRFEVVDNGKGMDASRLAEVRRGIGEDLLEISRESGYGLWNVNQRIKLYYGRQWGLAIESSEGEGTRVTLDVPALR